MCQTLAYIVFFNVEMILRNIYLITVTCWTPTYYVENTPRKHLEELKGKLLWPPLNDPYVAGSQITVNFQIKPDSIWMAFVLT